MAGEVDYKKLFLQLANVSDPLILETVISSSGSNLNSKRVYADIWGIEKEEEDIWSSEESKDTSSVSSFDYEFSLIAKNLESLEASIRRQKKLSETEELCKQREKQLRDILKESKHVDIAFLVDCTGSMSPYIAQVKNTIHNIVKDIYNKFDNKIRLAFVGYRDHIDGSNRFECQNFTTIEEFVSFVENIVITGGGDIPEDVLGGIESAVNLDWISKNKVIFHIGDAPHHGKAFHNMPSSKDDHYEVDPGRLDISILLKRIKKMDIKYFFGRIKSSTDKMISEFKKIGGDDIVTVVDIQTPNLLEQLVVSSVTDTIEDAQLESLELSRSADYINHRKDSVANDCSRALKDYYILHEKPTDEHMSEIYVSWLNCNIPTDLRKTIPCHNIKGHIVAVNHNWSYEIKVKKGTHPFSEGQQRISYHGLKGDKQIVLKEFKYFGEGRDRREDYIQIMETQTIAAFLANEFNIVSPKGSKKIHFLKVNVIQHYLENKYPVYYNVEMLLPEYKNGFTKWNNNAGRVSKKNFSLLLDAFSHWTYDITKGFLLVVDLQGVERDDCYVLTDPSINCIEQRFGGTNIGEIGTELFFSMHECGNICKLMGLRKNKYMKDVKEICSCITGPS